MCIDVVLCTSWWSMTRGLMLAAPKNLLFVLAKPVRARLHMLLVFYPIHVVGLDAHGMVVCIARLKPFHFWTAPRQVKYILELSKRPYILPRMGQRLNLPGRSESR